MSKWFSWANISHFAKLISALTLFNSLFSLIAAPVFKMWLDRPNLKFLLSATHVDAAEEDEITIYVDGVPFTRALCIRVTNNSPRPVTVREARLVYSLETKEGKLRQISAHAHIDKKIGDGESCEGYLKLYSKPNRIVSVNVAIGSSEKARSVSNRQVKTFNSNGLLRWH